MPSSPGPSFFAFVFGSPTAPFVFHILIMLMETGLKTSKIEMVEAGLVVVNMYNSTFSHSVLVACRLQFTVSLSVTQCR